MLNTSQLEVLRTLKIHEVRNRENIKITRAEILLF